jgi:pimeloyl-ACP methyl ester carboxylesterase
MRFVLIHGGFHGAWCWSRTIPELERLGHTAIAIDLPGHGQRRDERSTLADRRGAILEVLERGDVLVGHSGGALDITIAADSAPEKIGHLIYLAGGLPAEGRTILDLLGGQKAAPSSSGERVEHITSKESGLRRIARPNAQGRLECVDFAGVHDIFYHDCDEATARWAFAHFTPAPIEFLVETISIPNYWKAALPRSYIRCLQDRATVTAQHAVYVDRLGVEPLTIDTSHSPFLSRPRELAELMVKATATTPLRPPRPN